MKTIRCRNFLSVPNLKSYSKAHTLAYNDLIETQKAHTRVLKLGLSIADESNILKSYIQSNAFSRARQLFDELPKWDVVSATSLIGHFAKHPHHHKKAIFFFSRMLELNIKPNDFTFTTVLHLSTSLKDLNLGQQIHACAIKTSFESNVFVGGAILDLYAKLSTIKEAIRAFEDTNEPNVVSYTTLLCGYLKKEWFDDALEFFRTMPERNVVSWNAMIGGYSQTGHNEEAVNLFVDMLREGAAVPTQSTFPCAISAAANIAAIGMGKSFHACAVKFLGDIDVFVGNALVSFYAKCGSMEDSLLVFNKLPERTIVSWNALICGYAQNGKGEEAMNVYKNLELTGLRPNCVSLLGLLLACNHGGLVDEGWLYFNQARREEHSMLKPEHYACMIDLLSRSGRFMEVEKFISELPFDPGIGFWKALLGGCQIHSNMELGEFAARKTLDLNPADVSSYVMLSNAHSAAGRWQSMSLIRKEMREKGMKRIPGCSWIEIKSKIHVFTTADKRHAQKDGIYMILKFFIQHSMEIEADDIVPES